MGTLVRFEDSATGCFARVDLESRDPLFISVAQTGVLVRRSKLGFLGRTLYRESNISEAARVAHALAGLAAPRDEIRTPMLAAFAGAAVSAKNMSALEALLAAARWAELGVVGDAGDLNKLAVVVRQVGSAVNESGLSPLGFSESLLPLSVLALKEILWLVVVHELRGDEDEPKRVEPLAFAYSQIAFAVPHEHAEAHRLASAMMLANDLSRIDEPWFQDVLARHRHCASQAALDAAEFLARFQAHPSTGLGAVV